MLITAIISVEVVAVVVTTLFIPTKTLIPRDTTSHLLGEEGK